MSALANPDTSQLLLIDPVSRYLCQLEDKIAARTSTQFNLLSVAADMALVPRTFAISHHDDDKSEWLSQPCEKRKYRVLRYERDRSVWSNSELLDAIKAENRDQLFICGFWLDDVVAAAAMEAQTFGFDTHIIKDLCLAYSRENWRSFLDRFTQYGIVPIPLHMLLYEWMAKTEDSERRQALEEIWQEQKYFQQAGASASRTGLS